MALAHWRPIYCGQAWRLLKRRPYIRKWDIQALRRDVLRRTSMRSRRARELPVADAHGVRSMN
jgi:hypothetical protein